MNVKCLAASLIAAGFVAGCGDPRVPRVEASVATNSAPGDFSPTVGDAGRPSAPPTRNQFVDDLRRKLSMSDQKISELGRKMETLNDEARAEAAKALESWRGQRVQLGQKLDEIKQSGQEAGQDIKAGCESAAAELEKAFEKLKFRFKE